MRALVLIAVVVGTLAVLLIARRAPAPQPVDDPPQLRYVTTAHQLGVVGYRDPSGAISPDGTRLAYAEGRFIRVIPLGGGAPMTLAPGEGQIRYLAWKRKDEIVAEDVTPSGRWWLYRIGKEGRTPVVAPRPDRRPQATDLGPRRQGGRPRVHVQLAPNYGCWAPTR